MKNLQKYLFVLFLLSFTRLSGQIILYGKVIDGNTGERLDNALVQLLSFENSLIEQKQTESNGEYRFNIKQTGSYRLKVCRAEYDNFVYETIKINQDDSIRRDVPLEKPPKFLCIINVNGTNCKDTLKEKEIGNDKLFRFKLFNSGPVPLKWIVGQNKEWISVFSSEKHTTSGILDSESNENSQIMDVTINPDKLEAGLTVGKVLVMSNNGNAILSIKATGKYPEISILPIKELWPSEFKGVIQFEGRHTYKEMGFCFSDINENPSIKDNVVLANDIGNFTYNDHLNYGINGSSNFSWLEGFLKEEDICRTYYVRAFLKYENENDTVIYSKNVEHFTLLEIFCE
jgi:hypothetical protein